MPIDVDRREVQRLTREGGILLEVLPSKQYEEEHLPGAINIPLRKLDSSTLTHLDQNKPVVVYCYDAQ